MLSKETVRNNGYLTFDILTREADLVSAVSSRHLGNMSLSYGETVNSLENRRHFLGELGIDYSSLICGKQTHGNNIKYATRGEAGKGALEYGTAIDDTDALVTDEKNLPLAVFTADCLSVFLYDRKKPAIGMVHAGWRSSALDISGQTARYMREKFGTNMGDLLVGFGPSIRSCCYEVTEEFRRHFGFGLIEKNGKIYLDLIAVNKRQLTVLGVGEANIFDSGICTVCSNEDYFSFRKEGKSCGRMLSVMMLK